MGIEEYKHPEGYHAQRFYCNASVLLIEMTKNGIFAVIAPFKEKQGGNNTYNWDQKQTYYLTLDEISNLKAGAAKFVNMKFSGATETTAFNKFCAALFEKDNYKSLTLCHDYSKTAKASEGAKIFKYFGLEAYTRNGQVSLNFITKSCTGAGATRKTLKELKFHFPASSLVRFMDFLDFLQKEGFRRNLE